MVRKNFHKNINNKIFIPSSDTITKSIEINNQNSEQIAKNYMNKEKLSYGKNVTIHKMSIN